MKPVGDRRLDFISMGDPDQVVKFRFRGLIYAPHLGSFEPPSQEDTQFEIFLFRTHEEVAGFPREHDRVVRGVDTLLAESSRRFAQPFPRLAKIIGKMTRQSSFCCAPAIMRFSLPDPLLAVVTFVTGH
ncbi:MAG TPA: hypothetical protein VMF91_26805 [Bryobacteraceae bacterium]|nr:hypothetical protein [Bryobacteraceae bacterium]